MNFLDETLSFLGIIIMLKVFLFPYITHKPFIHSCHRNDNVTKDAPLKVDPSKYLNIPF